MHHGHKGRHPRQAHVGIPDGTFEEEFGREGFFGPVSHLYHTHPPTSWTSIDGPLKPRAFNLNGIPPTDDGTPVLILHNADIRVAVSGTPPTWYQRDADVDQLFFVHAGSGNLETDFGTLTYETGDYLVIPRCVTHRFHPDACKHFLLILQPHSPIVPPSDQIKGLLGRHALYDLSAVTMPELPEIYEERAGVPHEIRITSHGEVTTVVYPFNPLDAAGWKGDLYPWKINVRDLRPVMSHRVHLPPPVHSTFAMRNAIVCTFLPRPLEEDEDCLKVPFFHRNADYDEVLFYHAGDFFSRDNIGPGMMTLHPMGIHHGPHPQALAKQHLLTRTNEVAVMLDTRFPLQRTSALDDLEWAGYWKSWNTEPTV